MIDVGLIGFGFAGRTFHAPVIRAVSGLRLAAIVQRSGTEAEESYSDVSVVRSLDELLSFEQIRLVVIATPNFSHYSLARQCLQAGKDVVIDKPFATTWQEAAELVEVARSAGRLLSVYQNRRWDGDFLTVQRLANAGALGRPVLFESHFDRFRPQPRANAWRERPEPGSGMLFDLGPHLIDQAMVLFGTPEAITADIRTEREQGRVDDAFDIVLHYPRLRAVLRSTMLAAAPALRFLLHGTSGSYVKYGMDPQEDALKRGERPVDASWGKEPESRWGTLTTEARGSITSQAVPTEAGDYRRYYENIRDALAGRTQLAATPEQALKVMRVLELARESSERRCTLPWPAGE